MRYKTGEFGGGLGRVPYARGAREGALRQVVAKGDKSKDLHGKGGSDWSGNVKCMRRICEQPRHLLPLPLMTRLVGPMVWQGHGGGSRMRMTEKMTKEEVDVIGIRRGKSKMGAVGGGWAEIRHFSARITPCATGSESLVSCPFRDVRNRGQVPQKTERS
jgi:hypothetical protein